MERLAELLRRVGGYDIADEKGRAPYPTVQISETQTGPLIMPGPVLPLSFSSPSLQSKFKVSDFLVWHQGAEERGSTS